MTPLEGLLPERLDSYIITKIKDGKKIGVYSQEAKEGYNSCINDCLAKLEEAVREGRIVVK